MHASRPRQHSTLLLGLHCELAQSRPPLLHMTHMTHMRLTSPHEEGLYGAMQDTEHGLAAAGRPREGLHKGTAKNPSEDLWHLSQQWHASRRVVYNMMRHLEDVKLQLKRRKMYVVHLAEGVAEGPVESPGTASSLCEKIVPAPPSLGRRPQRSTRS